MAENYEKYVNVYVCVCVCVCTHTYTQIFIHSSIDGT